MFKGIKIVALCCSGLMLNACGGGGGDGGSGKSTGFFGQPLYRFWVKTNTSGGKVHLDMVRERYDLQSGVELATAEDVLGMGANAFFGSWWGEAQYGLTATRLFVIPETTEAHETRKISRILQVSADGKVDMVPYSPENFTDNGRSQIQYSAIDLSGKPISAELPDYLSTGPFAAALTALKAANPVFPAGSMAYREVSYWTRDNIIWFYPSDKTDKTSLNAWSSSVLFIPPGSTVENFTWANGIPVRCYVKDGDYYPCGVLYEGKVYQGYFEAATAAAEPTGEPDSMYNKTAADAYRTAIQRHVQADTPTP